MYDIEQRVAALEKKTNQLIRVGLVDSINPDKGTARVMFPDGDNSISYNLLVLFPNAQDDKYYTMPDVGEQVVCVFLPIGMELGFVLGSFYSVPDAVPVSSPDKYHVRFKDGTVVEYDRGAHRLLVDVKGTIDILATGNITINGKRVDIN